MPDDFVRYTSIYYKLDRDAGVFQNGLVAPFYDGSNELLCAAVGDVTLRLVAHAPALFDVPKNRFAVHATDNLGAGVYYFHILVLQSISARLLILNIFRCCEIHNICSRSIEARLLPVFYLTNCAKQLR